MEILFPREFCLPISGPISAVSITQLTLPRQSRDFLTSCSGDNTSILKQTHRDTKQLTQQYRTQRTVSTTWNTFLLTFLCTRHTKTFQSGASLPVPEFLLLLRGRSLYDLQIISITKERSAGNVFGKMNKTAQIIMFQKAKQQLRHCSSRKFPSHD